MEKKSCRTIATSSPDGTIEVIFVEMTGEDIDRLILLQERWHDTIQVQPIVEYQDGLVRFQHETTMEDVGQCHCVLVQVIFIWGIPSNMKVSEDCWNPTLS